MLLTNSTHAVYKIKLKKIFHHHIKLKKIEIELKKNIAIN